MQLCMKSAPAARRAARFPAAALALASLLAGAPQLHAQGWLDGFHSFDWKEFFTYHTEKEKAEGKARESGGRKLFCPEIIVLDGTAAIQSYAGTPQTNQNLRSQIAITDAVRECAMQGDEIAFKVGVAGHVLLGPAGQPGSFSVPVRVAVVNNRDNDVIVSKLFHATATIPAGEAEAEFSVVTDPLLAPYTQDHAEDDYTIKVGLDEAGAKAAGAAPRKKR
ncbi:hypothetical protein [Methylocella sp.]|uniref:hypothetical protein n=1 Tax=Methylocella sp. TaxID=1978226 RepID=UPI003784AF93